MLERLLAALDSRRKLATFAVAGLLASLAAVTRYDAWLALPMVAVAAWWFARGPIPRRRRAAWWSSRWRRRSLPVAWIAWGAATADDPLFFAHYISSDHAQLAATAAARYGAWLGAGAPARRSGRWRFSRR